MLEYLLKHFICIQVESEKLNIRVWPKVSPFTTPAALGTNLNEVNKPASAKFVTQKQFQMQQTQFDIIRNSLRHNIDHELREFDHMMTNFIKCRSRWQHFFQLYFEINKNKMISKFLNNIIQKCFKERKPQT